MNAVVLEGEATPPSLEQWLIDYGKNHEDKLTHELLELAVVEAYLFDTVSANFTDKGLDLLEKAGVPLRQITVITLGRPISAFDKDGNKFNIRPTSQVLALFSGRNRKTGQQWDDVRIGDDFPIARLYRSALDTRTEHRWPATWPLTGRYLASKSHP